MAKGKTSFLARKLRVLKRQNKIYLQKSSKNERFYCYSTNIKLLCSDVYDGRSTTEQRLYHNYVHKNEKNNEEMRNLFNCRRIASF